MKLAILTAGFLLPYITEKIQTPEFTGLGVDISVLNYKNFSYISELYHQVQDHYDGFLVSGLAAFGALEKGVSVPLKPSVAFEADTESLYRALLSLKLQYPQLKMTKVIFDFLLPQNSGFTADSFLNLEEPGFAQINAGKFWWSRSLDELKAVENHVYDLILDKWELGELEYVLSRYPSLLPRLKEKDIPCSFLYPTVYQLYTSIKECINTVHLAGMKDYLPGVIAVFKSSPEESHTISQDMDLDILALQKALLEFNKESLTDYQLQKFSNGFYIFTNRKTIHRITDYLSSCSLSTFLSSHLSFKTDIAYGIAKDIGQAKTNASLALNASMRDHHVYAVNEAGTMIGPLDPGAKPMLACDLTPQLEEIASRSHLSPLTVQKLKALVVTSGSADITIAELADKLGIKQRNANRILSNMVQSNDAVISGARASSTKGRPTKVYRLLAFTDEPT